MKQKGAALVIVLSLLAGMLIIGVSGMNSTFIDQRLSGNYRAVTMANMAAEWGGSSRVEEADFNSLEHPGLCSTLVDNENIDETDVDDCREDDCLIKIYKNEDDEKIFSTLYNYKGCMYEVSDGEFIDADFVVGQVRDANDKVMAESFLIVSKEDESVSTGPDDFPTALSSSLVCIGPTSDPGCPSESDFSGYSYFSGESSQLPESFNCNGRGCRQNSDSSNSYSTEENLDEWEVFSSSLAGIEKVAGNSLTQGIRNEPNIIEIIGNKVDSPGNINTSGIIVVRDGGVFEASGTGSHEGLIIVEAGGEINLGSNFSLYGSVVALGGLGGIFDGSSNPNGGARYNQEALTGLSKGEGGYIWLSP